MAGGGGGESGDFGFQIAPMVDVVFVLLLFFMACAGQQQKEKSLAINLPSTAKGEEKISVPILVDIDPLGRVFIGGESKGGGGADHDLEQFTEALRAATQGENPDPVIIRPNPETPHERVIDVLNSCKKADVKKLSFS
jgi:biopolymer transport protein ExbD